MPIRNPNDLVIEIGGKYYEMHEKINPSFITTSGMLRHSGINNYYFMLELKDPSIAGLDMYSPTLTGEEKIAISHEIHDNMWYFLRNFKYKVSDKICQYPLTRGLAAACWNFQNNRNFYLRGNRQSYKSWGLLAGPILWKFITDTDSSISIGSKSSNDARLNLSIIKGLIDYIPDYILYFIALKYRGFKSNATRISSYVSNNEIKVLSSPRSKESATNIGRGLTSDTILLDDTEFIKYFNNLFESILIPNSAAKLDRDGNGCIMMASSKNFDYSNKAIDSGRMIPDLMIPWTERFYDCTNNQIDAYITKYLKQSKNIIPAWYLDYAEKVVPYNVNTGVLLY